MTPPPRVVLKPQRAKPFFGRHPWVFAGAVARVVGEPSAGQPVAVYSAEGEFVAWGLYNDHSQILVRLYSWDYDRPLDDAFWRDRLVRAVRLRRDQLGLVRPGHACRLVFSEADGISGLVADWYDGWLVLQPTALGIRQRLELFARLLAELVPVRGVYVRTEKGMREAEGMELEDHLLEGDAPPELLEIHEGALRFYVNIRTGQKTGWYLDQRENRQAAARYARERRVLDLFSYAAGFALHCARAGAREVLAVDSSAAAIELGERNVMLNAVDTVRFERADVFRWLDQAAAQGDRWQMIIIDPPRLARRRKGVPGALRGYAHLNRKSMELLEPEGILVTCSCSGQISRELFAGVLREAAFAAGRELQILEQRGAAPDHPISVYCPENAYLKCFICRVL